MYGWISHHLPACPPPFSKRNRIFLGLSDILDSYSLSLPVQLIEGWFCWQMLCILHPGSLWTPHFLPYRKEINKHMGVIAVTLLRWKTNDGSKHFFLLSTKSLFLPATGKYFCLPGTVLLTSIQSTYFLPCVSADRAVVWAVLNTRDIAHCATYWDHPGLMWGGSQWAVGIFYESPNPLGSATLPRELIWPMVCGWVLGPSDERLRCHCDIPASQHLDCFLLCFLPSLLHPGSHTSLSGYRLNRSWSRDWKLGPCRYPRICSLGGDFELWSAL